MSALITWLCDHGGCFETREVAAELCPDGSIYGNDQWPPDGWGGIDGTLCPEHELARQRKARAEMEPDAEWTA